MGNVLWGIQNDELICFELIQKDKQWSYNTYKERDSPPYLSCPLHFFKICETTNEKWRNEVIEKKQEELRIGNEIKELLNKPLTGTYFYVEIKSKPGFCFPYGITDKYWKNGKEISLEEFQSITDPVEKMQMYTTAILQLTKTEKNNCLVARGKNKFLYKIPKRMITKIYEKDKQNDF